MSGEYEPKDSRNVTGTKGRADSKWREKETSERGGEYAPRDQRDVHGTSSDDRKSRWSGKDSKEED
jgi:hypothetical protein